MARAARQARTAVVKIDVRVESGLWKRKDDIKSAARRAVTNARHPLAFQPDDLPVTHAGGDADIQRASVRQHDPAGGAVHRVKEVERQMILRILATHRELPSSTAARAGAASEGLSQDVLQVTQRADLIPAIGAVVENGIVDDYVLQLEIKNRQQQISDVVRVIGIAPNRWEFGWRWHGCAGCRKSFPFRLGKVHARSVREISKPLSF